MRGAAKGTARTSGRKASTRGPSSLEPSAWPAPFRAVVDALKGEAGVTVGKGWGGDNVVLKLSGKICVMLVRGELVLKLPRTRVDALLEEGVGKRFDPRHDGRQLKEWLVVSAEMADWVALAREPHQFARKAKAGAANGRR